jgi:hypothetical protein
MVYRRLLKLKENIRNITHLEAAYRYLRSLEGTPTFHAHVLQQVFIEFGDSYTLLNVYNIFEILELAHAHYEANTMRPPSHRKPQPPPTAPTRSSHSSLRAKAVDSVAPILPSYIYLGNLAHKTSECNIPSKDLFCDYCGKKGHQEVVYFTKVRNESNFDYCGKIYQHLLLPLNQKARHLSLPFKFSPPRVIAIRMLRKRSTMLTRGGASNPCRSNSNSTK